MDRSPLEDYFKMIARHCLAPEPSWLLGRTAGSAMFHGSASDFLAVEARPNRRINKDRSVAWSGTAIFAAMDPRIGFFYTAARSDREFGKAIDLKTPLPASEPVIFELFGGSNLDQAKDVLYGRVGDLASCTGYLYVLDKSKFVREPGLGANELITRDASANLGRLLLNRRAAIEALVARGMVQLEWSPD